MMAITGTLSYKRAHYNTDQDKEDLAREPVFFVKFFLLSISSPLQWSQDCRDSSPSISPPQVFPQVALARAISLKG